MPADPAPQPDHEARGEITTGTARVRATLLAGVLAELAVPNLVLQCGCNAIPLAPRVTDLPAQLLDATSDGDTVTLEAPAIGAWFEVTPQAVQWGCRHPQAAAYLAKHLV